MSRVYASALIRQPIELVFNYVTTPGNWPRWHLSSLAVSGATNHSLDVGEQVTEEFLVAGRLGRAVWTVTERAEPRRWVIDGQVIGSNHGGRVIYSLSAHGEMATLFEREFFYEFSNPIQRLVDKLFIRPRIVRESVNAVNRLQERLEELGATPAPDHGKLVVEPFHFLTLWHFDAPLERVWEELNKPREFPNWWPGFEYAESLTDGPPGVGSITRYHVRGDFNVLFEFELRVVEHHPPSQMKLEASGDFIGTGEWKLRPEGEGCAVTYVWNVAVQKTWSPWVRFLPGMRHRLEQSHDKVMTQGGKNLAAILARADGRPQTADDRTPAPRE